MSHSFLHLDLDGAWPAAVIPGINYSDCRKWGPALRYCTTDRLIEQFLGERGQALADFTLYGSGDFHHLTATLLRRVTEPFTLVSFDNHPDWDIRPPHWGCGTWLNRALELSQLKQAVVWGCANGELNWPRRMFARRSRQLDARPWAEKTSPSSQRRWRAVTRAQWREQFSFFAARLTTSAVYVTVDLDCLREGEARTNWENGLFTAAEVAWALRELRRRVRIVGGDVCGAWSAPEYSRRFQKLIAWIDHPKPKPEEPSEALTQNVRGLHIIWPALTARDERDAGADQ
jgi:hypothetical protein